MKTGEVPVGKHGQVAVGSVQSWRLRSVQRRRFVERCAMISHACVNAFELLVVERQERREIEVHVLAQGTRVNPASVLAPLRATRQPDKVGHLLTGQIQTRFQLGKFSRARRLIMLDSDHGGLRPDGGSLGLDEMFDCGGTCECSQRGSGTQAKRQPDFSRVIRF